MNLKANVFRKQIRSSPKFPETEYSSKIFYILHCKQNATNHIYKDWKNK